ncbi:MAG: 4-hydroxythreonine-4-phosphate dehydrogenase PdxA [Lachnospiraceae bacterium]|nr:4-hydroxythreonine-4-phosphate dehydrogenase PdxA [Lachnospiraceae bacterium]
MRPIIGITMGDPVGTGPELSVKALLDRHVYEICRPLIVGDACCMEVALRQVQGAEALKIHPVERVQDALFEYGTIDVYDMKLVDIGKRVFAKDRAALREERGPEADGLIAEGARMCGNAAFRYVKKVIELAMAGEVDATVTNALNKGRMNAAGHHFDGHTEIYARFTGTKRYAMMLAHGDFRVIHVSTHVSLREACDRVKKARVLEVIRLADEECRRIGIEKPRIAVAGLNPHCGEGGLFGREEIEEIQPAIDEALAESICIPEKAPTPPDTVFSKLAGGWYDMAVVMYHDQGHIPTKLKGFVYDREKQKWEAVSGINVTVGLPIVRVSVDHGTGEDIAGLGIAEPDSLLNSIEYATISSLRRS